MSPNSQLDPILQGAALSAAILRGENVPTPVEPPTVEPPAPGDVPLFFLPTLRRGLRQKLWTRYLVKMYSKKISRTTGVAWKDKDGNVVKTTRHKGASKLERRTIRRNLTTVSAK